jgi:Xaa-Pro aminopeptidase
MYKSRGSYRIRGALGWTGTFGVGGPEQIDVEYPYFVGLTAIERAIGANRRSRHFSSGVVMDGLSSGPRVSRYRSALFHIVAAAVCGVIAFATISPSASAQQRREREPNSVYAARRAKLAAEVDAPIVLWGYTGREEISEAAIFAQEENFYYLTGHNEEGAALVIWPASKPATGGVGADVKSDILFLPPKNVAQEKWNGVRMSPTDPGIEARTGFASVQPIDKLSATLEKSAKTYPEIYTILPYETEMGGYPHEKDEMEWLDKNAPQLKRKDIREKIGALRQIKSPGEIAFLKVAVDLSDDAHMEAMKMMRPGLYEYQIAAKMVETHLMGGSEAEGYSPIVGAGPNSTALHYDKLSRKIEDGDIVVLDVGAQFAGYSADITRTLPANGKFTPRQREIYEIVLGAQNAAIAAVKPGAQLCRKGENSLFKLSYDYINTHGKDKQSKPLGQYFIHGLGHHIGLNVHDAGDSCRVLEPGMVVTIEPGIYIPDENLGVRIEDDVLVTETGVKVLSEKLPRNPDEIETIMAAAAKKRATDGKKGDD